MYEDLTSPHMRKVIMMVARTLALGLFLFVTLSSTAYAATVRLSPPESTLAVGDILSIRVMLTSTDQSVNAVSGVLHFPPDLLSLTSISKAESIIGLWVQEPSYSNSAGTARFEGLILNPGFTGSGGTVLTIRFKALKKGTPKVTLSGVQALANDGSGTDILSASSGASITISQVSTIPVQPAAATSTAPQTEIPVDGPLVAPILTIVPNQVALGEVLSISGTSQYPGAIVTVALARDEESLTFETNKSDVTYLTGYVDSSQHFQVSRIHHFPPGKYYGAARVTTASGASSPPSETFALTLKGESVWTILVSWIKNVGFGFVGALLLMLIIAAVVTAYLRHRAMKRDVRKELRAVDDTVHASFLKLRDGIEALVQAIESQQVERKLTLLESQIIQQMKQQLVDTEDAVKKEVHASEDRLE